MPLDETGYSARRTSEWFTILTEEFKQALADNGVQGVPNFVRDLFFGTLFQVISWAFGLLDEGVQDIYAARDPNNATGANLSSLGLAVGVERSRATASVQPVSLAGTAGTIVAAGQTVRGGGEDGKALWLLEQSVTLPGDGTLKAQELGAIEGPAVTTAWEIVTPVLGWTSVASNGDTIVGEERESDDEFRLRRQIALQAGGSASANAIRAAIADLDLADAVAVLENDSGLPATIEGLTLPPKSVGVILYPSTIPQEDLAIIAEAIYDNTPGGIQTSGTESTTVTGADLNAKEVRWSYPADLLVIVEAHVQVDTPEAGNPLPPPFLDVKPLVDAVINTYGAALDPNNDVLRLDILRDIAAVDGVRSVPILNLLVPASPGSIQPTGDVEILATQRANIVPAVLEYP